MEYEKTPDIVKTTEKTNYEYRLKAQTEHDGWIEYLYEQWLIPFVDTTLTIVDGKENLSSTPILTGYRRFQITTARKDFHAAEIELVLTNKNIK